MCSWNGVMLTFTRKMITQIEDQCNRIVDMATYNSGDPNFAQVCILVIGSETNTDLANI